MKIYHDCIPCFLRQALEAARKATEDEAVHRQVLDTVAGMIPEFPLNITPPEIAQRVYAAVADITGNEDPFRESKQQANELTLSLYPHFKKLVAGSSDPLLAAAKLAIAGNIIDFGPQSSYGDVKSIAESAMVSPLGIDNYCEFKADIGNSSRILYLGDNAGEITFDRILLEEIRRIKKDVEIYFLVREKPAINDATLSDALATGIDRTANVISSGSDAPATILSQCSPRVLQLYQSADIVIAKGQGNYESLSDETKNIFFLLRVKCQVIAMLLKAKIGDAVLKKQSL